MITSIGPEALYSVQNVATDGPTAIYAGPCILVGYHVNTAIATADALLMDNTTMVATAASGTASGWVSCGNMRIETSLNIDPADTATGNMTVVYIPNNDGQMGAGYSGA